MQQYINNFTQLHTLPAALYPTVVTSTSQTSLYETSICVFNGELTEHYEVCWTRASALSRNLRLANSDIATGPRWATWGEVAIALKVAATVSFRWTGGVA